VYHGGKRAVKKGVVLKTTGRPSIFGVEAKRGVRGVGRGNAEGQEGKGLKKALSCNL